jgi:hypothetical protein
MVKGLFSNIGDPTSGPSNTIKPPKVTADDMTAMASYNPVEEDEFMEETGTVNTSKKPVSSVSGAPENNRNKANAVRSQGDGGRFPGQLLINGNSTIIQMITDSKGEPKSQTVITVENVMRQITDVNIIENEKNHERRIQTIGEKVDTMLQSTNNQDDEPTLMSERRSSSSS